MGVASLRAHTGNAVMKLKSKLMLWLACCIASGVIAYLSLSQYLSQQSSLWVEQHAEPTEAFLVVNRDKPQGSIILVEDLSSRSLPLRFAQPDWLRPEDAANVLDAVVKIPLISGEPLQMKQLEPRRLAVLRGQLGANERAVTLAVNHEQAIAGMLQPGDFVDIAVLRQANSTEVEVLYGIEVLAVDQQLYASSEPQAEAFIATVTLKLTLAEAQQFEQMKQASMSFWLHGLNRHQGTTPAAPNERETTPTIHVGAPF